MQDLHLQSNSINLDEFLLSIFCPDSQYPDKWLMHTFFIKIWIFAWIISLRRTSSNVSRVPQLSPMWTKFERDLNWHMGEKPLLLFENSENSIWGIFFCWISLFAFHFYSKNFSEAIICICSEKKMYS